MSRFVAWLAAYLLLFLVIAAGTDLGWDAVFIGVAVLPVVGVAVLVAHLIIGGLRSWTAPVEWPNARVGVATVTKVESTTELRDGRRLITMKVWFEPADGGESFDSTFTRRVPAESVAGVQPGLQFPAMHRPDRPGKVKIARGPVQKKAQHFFEQVRVRDGMVDEQELRAAREGVLTEADVIGVEPTDRSVGGIPVYDVTLRIWRRGEIPLEHRKAMPLSSFEHDLLAAAPSVRVKYLPENPQVVAVAIENREKELS